MACTGCTVKNNNTSATKGCNSNNGCSSGGCNKLNTFDWLNALNIEDVEPYHIVEISFKNGARKAFYKLPELYVYNTGDYVVVEDKGGYDVGQITLSGDLVRLQMRKKKANEDKVQLSVMRKASEKDLQKLEVARSKDQAAMVRARVIARTLDLEMKIGDVEFRGDNRKVTFYYTAEGRVDFRELIRHYAKEFKVKIEMRQIGTRQESALIGGLGSCGRELCCSTWLTNFKSVSTSAARHQNLAINQAKLSGQCGRLKCCLNYELDTYLDALKRFPKQSEKLKLQTGTAVFVKTDIFKGLMFYMFKSNTARSRVFSLQVEKVQEIIKLNKKGILPVDLSEFIYSEVEPEGEEIDFQTDTTDVLDLPPEKKAPRKRKPKKRPQNKNNNNRGGGNKKPTNNRRKEGSNAKPSTAKKARSTQKNSSPSATKQNSTHPHNADDHNKKNVQREHQKHNEKADAPANKKRNTGRKPNNRKPLNKNTPKADNQQQKTNNRNQKSDNRKPSNNNKPQTDNQQQKTDNKKTENGKPTNNRKRRRPPRKNNNKNNQNNNKNIDK